MSSVFDILAEQRITEAIRRGELSGLPGEGRPLQFEDDLFLSPEQRMVSRVLRNAGFAPPEIGLRREIAELRAAVATAGQPEARARLKQQLAMALIQLAEMRRAS